MKYLGISVLMVTPGKDITKIKVPKYISVRKGKKVLQCPIGVVCVNSLEELEKSMKGGFKNLFKAARDTFNEPQEQNTPSKQYGEQLQLKFD